MTIPRLSTRTALLCLGTAAVVVGLLAGCSAPRVIGEPYAGAGRGTLATDPSDTGPAVGWVREGERFFVTTYGSSSCPIAPTRLESNDDGPMVTMTRTGGDACTADFGPASYALDLPERFHGRERVTVSLRFEDDGRVVRRELRRSDDAG